MGNDQSNIQPDERRIVRAGVNTRVYARHTDGIYRDTDVWRAVGPVYSDPDGIVFNALKQTMRLPSTTLGDECVNLLAGSEIVEMPDIDRDIDAERQRLVRDVNHAKQQAELAWEQVITANVRLAEFDKEHS